MEKELKAAKKANEEILTWLKAKDFLLFDKNRLSEVEILERAGTYQIFWRTYLEKDLARITWAQTQMMAQSVETNEQLLFLRGIIEGINIVKRYFEEQNNLALEKFSKDEPL